MTNSRSATPKQGEGGGTSLLDTLQNEAISTLSGACTTEEENAGSSDAVDVTLALKEAADALSDALAALDQTLLRIDEGLNRAQPPITGKLRIHFLKARGTHPAPALVEWRRSSKQKKWWPTRLPWKSAGARAKFSGGFALNYQQTQALIAEAARLVVLRQEMLAKRRYALLSIRSGAARLKKEAEVARERADQWHAECEENIAIKRG